jgi:hypothetical protein
MKSSHFQFDVFISFYPSNTVHNLKYVTKIELCFYENMLDNYAIDQLQVDISPRVYFSCLIRVFLVRVLILLLWLILMSGFVW